MGKPAIQNKKEQRENPWSGAVVIYGSRHKMWIVSGGKPICSYEIPRMWGKYAGILKMMGNEIIYFGGKFPEITGITEYDWSFRATQTSGTKCMVVTYVWIIYLAREQGNFISKIVYSSTLYKRDEE